MRTIDGVPAGGDGFLRRFRRDLGVIMLLTRQALDYFVTGGRVRRAYKASCQRGEPYWLDEEEKR